MIQITEVQAWIFSQLISKVIDDYNGENNPFVVSLKMLRNEIDMKIAESELEHEHQTENVSESE